MAGSTPHDDLPCSQGEQGKSLSSFGVLRLDDWLLHLDSHELRRDALVRTLEPKPMQLLLLLLERTPNTVTREEIFTAVWPGLVVADNAIHQAIATLRRALDDSARSPNYISTEARRGYRWIGSQAEPVLETASSSSTSVDNRPLAWVKANTLKIGIRLGALLLILLATVSLWPREPEPRKDFVHFTHLPMWVAPFETMPTPSMQDSTLTAYRAQLVAALLQVKGIQLTSKPTEKGYHLYGRVEVEHGRTYTVLQLNDRVQGRILWSHRFTHDPTDHRFVQAPLAATFVERVISWYALEAELLSRDFADPVAIYEYTQGQIEWHAYALGAGSSPLVAVAHFEESLRLQPDFWLSQLQLTILLANRFGPFATYAEHHQHTKAAIRRTLELRRVHGRWADTMVWEGAVAIASQRLDLDYDFSEAMWLQARKRGWDAKQVYSERATIYAARGDLGTAIDYYQAARAGGSQINQSTTDMWLGYTLIAANRLTQAKQVLSAAAANMHDEGAVAAYTHVLHVFALQLLEDPQAAAALDRAWARYGADNADVFAGILALGGRNAEARALLTSLEQRFATGTLTRSWYGVLGHLFLGEPDRALDWLERAVEEQEMQHVAHIKNAPYLEPLRSMPRFGRVLERLRKLEAEPSAFRQTVSEHRALNHNE